MLKDARFGIVEVIIVRGRGNEPGATFALELTSEQQMNGVKKPLLTTTVMAGPLPSKLIDFNYDERTQVLESLRLLVTHSPHDLSQKHRRDEGIVIVEVPKWRFADPKWRTLPLRVYAMSYVEPAEAEPVAGMFFGLAPGQDVLRCLDLFKSLRSENAKAACALYAHDPALIVFDVVRTIDCPPLIRMLSRARRDRP